MSAFRQIIITAVAALTLFGGCSKSADTPVPDTVTEIRPGFLQGYLPPEALPDSLKLVPPPPVHDSAAFTYDEEVSRQSARYFDTPRWHQAAKDADLSFPAAADVFTEALGFKISKNGTPHTYMLLRRVLTDAGLSTYGAKKRYQRARPFMVNHQPICTPEIQKGLEHDGSYPSGHSAVGWAWALILSEIVPERSNAILARGRAFGQSRVICNVHWQSDVNEGRIMGAAVVARLHADPVFRAEMALAKQELIDAKDML